nr:hypothetical protein [Hymenobacter negativus]
MNEEISCLKKGLDKKCRPESTARELAGKYAICNHLAKLSGTGRAFGPSNPALGSFNHKKRPRRVARPFFMMLAQRCDAPELLLVFVVIVTGRVFLLVFVAANQATANDAGSTANQGTFAAADYSARYGTRTATNGGTFGFIAPALLGSLGLNTGAG